MRNIVTIGGGTGTFVVLSALKDFPVRLTAIVSMSDDGGSTGILRDHYGVLPPGDVRRALVALSESSEMMRELFNYRFTNGGLNGHSFGNLFLSTLEKVTGDFDKALKETSRLLNIKGEVVPVTLDDVRLLARLNDGKLLYGETHIDIPKTKNRSGIKKVWLEPEGKLNPRVGKVLQKADLIVICPGDLYTSIIPNLLVKGMRQEIRKSKAKKVYFCSLMTKAGETNGFKAEDFLNKLEEYIGEGVLDYAVFNNKKPSQKVLKAYRLEKAKHVMPPKGKSRKGTKYILADLLNVKGGIVRHNPRKLSEIVMSI